MVLDCIDGLLSHIVLVLVAGVLRKVDGLDGLACCKFAARSYLVGGVAHTAGLVNVWGMRISCGEERIPFEGTGSPN